MLVLILKRLHFVNLVLFDDLCVLWYNIGTVKSELLLLRQLLKKQYKIVYI